MPESDKSFANRLKSHWGHRSQLSQLCIWIASNAPGVALAQFLGWITCFHFEHRGINETIWINALVRTPGKNGWFASPSCLLPPWGIEHWNVETLTTSPMFQTPFTLFLLLDEVTRLNGTSNIWRAPYASFDNLAGVDSTQSTYRYCRLCTAVLRVVPHVSGFCQFSRSFPLT